MITNLIHCDNIVNAIRFEIHFEGFNNDISSKYNEWKSKYDSIIKIISHMYKRGHGIYVPIPFLTSCRYRNKGTCTIYWGQVQQKDELFVPLICQELIQLVAETENFSIRIERQLFNVVKYEEDSFDFEHIKHCDTIHLDRFTTNDFLSKCKSNTIRTLDLCL